jgi:alpha-L-rhamnosidase
VELSGKLPRLPHRLPDPGEKGWLGDAHLACEQAMLNWDNRPGYAKWMRDFADVQSADGGLKYIVPTPEWGAELPDWTVASLLIPWYVHLYTGDLEIVRASYPMMKNGRHSGRARPRVSCKWTE